MSRRSRQYPPAAPVPPAAPRPDVHLEVLTAGHRLRAAVLRLAPRPEQEQFCSRAAATLPESDADPGRTAFAVVEDAGSADGVPVGFGVLDRRGYLAELVDRPDRAVLLRAFYVAAGAQGRGVGSRAAVAIRALAAGLEGVELVVLTVNVQNPAAVTAYLKGGFADTGARYLGGDNGPQLVLAGAVRPSMERVREARQATSGLARAAGSHRARST